MGPGSQGLNSDGQARGQKLLPAGRLTNTHPPQRAQRWDSRQRFASLCDTKGGANADEGCGKAHLAPSPMLCSLLSEYTPLILLPWGNLPRSLS